MERVWTFSTDNFTVALDVMDEDSAPEDQFDDARDVEFAREGGWHWFCAKVGVYQNDLELASDYLGGCSYNNLEDFKRGGYFHDMVKSAIASARIEVGMRRRVYNKVKTQVYL